LRPKSNPVVFVEGSCFLKIHKYEQKLYKYEFIYMNTRCKNMNLYSKTNIKLLSFLVRQHSPLYEREISRKSGLSIGAVSQALNEFFAVELVNRQKKGRMYFYEVNHTKSLVKQFKIFLTIFELNPLLLKIQEKCERIVLYGSCAFGTDFNESDVDLLIITREKKDVKFELNNFDKQYQRKISGKIFNNSEWLETKKRDIAYYNEVNKGITLWRLAE
jgi:predicted nucleotidyltransferase